MRWPSHLPVPSGVLLDLDGVIVDSTDAHRTAWSRLFAEQGVAFGPEDYERVAAGRSREAVIRAVLGEREDHDALMARKVELMHGIALPTIPGTLEFVRALKVPFAIATSSRVPDLLLEAASVAELFDVVVHRGQVGAGKPAPDVFLEAARRLELDPTRCVAIDDAVAGVQAALAAGCTVVGFGVDGGDLRVERLPVSWAEQWSASE